MTAIIYVVHVTDHDGKTHHFASEDKKAALKQFNFSKWLHSTGIVKFKKVRVAI
ncbi:hypothetical protein V2H45_18420 [Tumidithrix elongata RA019]|uniref:Phage protein n=1 Tax=Tumidithrix elongata BACA0141 TaxID=2716417 RepID=A0AAW9Q0Q7_9CYAN|nr:hypothetical protein [Tumidithrix elongata RA019]